MIITMEQLRDNDGVSPVSGVILCKGYSVQLTKNNKEYISGELMSGVVIPFKAWGSSVAFKVLKSSDFSGKVVNISGSFDDYLGSSSIVVDTIVGVDGYTEDQFMLTKYDAGAYWRALVDMSRAVMSPDAFGIADKVLFSNDIGRRFVLEFAASKHHDNCKSGLLAHTYKVMSLMRHVLTVYSALAPMSDLLYLGALLHDIGKVREMQYGNYQSCSVVTHRYLGVEMLSGYKDEIIAKFGEDWWLHLVSIMLQHHGEYGDPCRTVVAWVVNRVDNFDAEMTLLAQSLDMAVGGKVKLDAGYLALAPGKGEVTDEK